MYLRNPFTMCKELSKENLFKVVSNRTCTSESKTNKEKRNKSTHQTAPQHCSNPATVMTKDSSILLFPTLASYNPILEANKFLHSPIDALSTPSNFHLRYGASLHCY